MAIRISPEENAMRYNYLRIQYFRNKIKLSTILTQMQKARLWQMAKTGDLTKAEREYERIVAGVKR